MQNRNTYDGKLLISIIAKSEEIHRTISRLDFENVTIVSIFWLGECEPMDISSELGELLCPWQVMPDWYAQYALVEDVIFVIDIPVDTGQNISFMKELLALGVEKRQIVDASKIGSEQKSAIYYDLTIRKVLNYEEKFDFFATGISYMLTGLCLDEMRPWIGAKLAASSQDLYYSYQMAKYFLNRRQADKIKFCLIGITPYSFPYRMSLSENWGRELYYLPFLSMDPMGNVGDVLPVLYQRPQKKWLDLLCDAEYPAHLDILDGEILKNNILGVENENQRILAQHIINVVANKDYPDTVIDNKKILMAYIDLCKRRNIVPIAVIMPFCSLWQELWPSNRLKEFYDIFETYIKNEDLACIDYFNMRLPNSLFANMDHLNHQGARIVTQMLRQDVERVLRRK
jgi:hypothetical protein